MTASEVNVLAPDTARRLRELADRWSDAGAGERAWPAQAIEQISALKRLAVTATISVDDAVRHFQGARREIIARHLETLAILGELRAVEPDRYAGAAPG